MVAAITASIVSAQEQIPGADDIKRLEQMAERGDTAALHSVLEYYDINAPVAMTMIDEKGVGYEEAVRDTTRTATPPPSDAGVNAEEYFTSRLQYWLSVGLVKNDPLGTYIMGKRLYFKKNAKAMFYLDRAAELGNTDAMMLCGSIYLDNGTLDKAIKYYYLAYKKSVPCAGWKLAGCYMDMDPDKYKDQILDALIKSAHLECPDAVRAMTEMDPENPVWKEKNERLELEEVPVCIVPEEE